MWTPTRPELLSAGGWIAASTVAVNETRRTSRTPTDRRARRTIGPRLAVLCNTSTRLLRSRTESGAARHEQSRRRSLHVVADIRARRELGPAGRGKPADVHDGPEEEVVG